MTVQCTGTGANGDHCCYVDGETCELLRENVAGRRFACALLLEHDGWTTAVTDPRYAPIGRAWELVGQPFNYCQVFDPARCCRSAA